MKPLQSLHPAIIKAILQTNLQLNNIVHIQHYEDKTTDYWMRCIQNINSRISRLYKNGIDKISYFEKYQLFYPQNYHLSNILISYETPINLSKTIKNFIKSISYKYITKFMYSIKKNITIYDNNLKLATYSYSDSFHYKEKYIIILYINSYCFRNNIIKFVYIISNSIKLVEFHNYKQMLYLLYKNQPIKSYIIK